MRAELVQRGAAAFVSWLALVGLVRALARDGVVNPHLANALVIAATLAAIFGLLRLRFAKRQAPSPQPLVDQIDDLLPQTQCGQCGFGGCRPYAESLAKGESDINRCPPGGTAGIAKLAALLDRPIVPLDPACGVEKPRVLASIVEADCIGCTKCIQACPVDAIVGAPKLMHSVIADRCTGCELCVPPCPVDCIELRPAR